MKLLTYPEQYTDLVQTMTDIAMTHMKPDENNLLGAGREGWALEDAPRTPNAGANPAPGTKFKVVCSWCFPGMKFDVPVSHGICPKHYAEMIAQIPKGAA